MNKAELIKKVAEKSNYTETATADVVNHLLDEIIHQVSNGEKVTLADFGTFEPAYRAARAARNPRTGEPVDVPAKVAPTFKPFGNFKAAVNS